MKTYHCTCGQLIFFENSTCVNCHRDLGFLPESLSLSSLEPNSDPAFFSPSAQPKTLFRKCQNYVTQHICNWMISAEDQNQSFCVSCRLNQVIPNLSIEQNKLHWAFIEQAKRRLIYSLLALKLPLQSKVENPQQGLAFRFLAPTPEAPVLTGHEHGLITLNLNEADDVERERVRLGMNEPYRTLLGHFRHEIGHYYWDRLIAGTKFLEPFRELFGNEEENYDEALKRYYATGAPANWQENYLSVYACAHPWEDWAESWAHFLHIQDTLEVANDFGLVGKRIKLDPAKLENNSKTNLFNNEKTFDQVILAWLDLSVALNSINRSMGHKDLYPFILSSPVVEKLHFISRVIADQQA